jgi:N-acetylmuramate 1-kinase
MKGMVLAAGFGTRMLPVTRFLPKALLPAAGRPLLEWNLRHLAAHGVDEVVVNAHHLADEMRRWADALAQGGEAGFPRVHLEVEAEILGTGGGIANAAARLDSDPVVVVNADQLFRADLDAARRTHDSERFLATLLCVRDPRYAQVRAAGCRATVIEPRPVFGDPGLLTFTGVYFLAREAVERVVTAGRGAEARSPVDAGPGRGAPASSPRCFDIVPLFREWMAAGRLGVHLVEDSPFLEAGSPEAYLELLREQATGRPASASRVVPGSAAVFGFGFVSPGATVAEDAWIEESAVLDGAIVEPGSRVIRCILGPGAVARGWVTRCIVAGGESRPIGLLPAPEEEALCEFLGGAWPEETPTRPVTASAPPGPAAENGWREPRADDGAGRVESQTQSHEARSHISLRLLKGDGSARRVVRVVRGAESRVLVLPAAPDPHAGSIYPVRQGPGVPDEAAAFAYIDAHLARLGVPVPRIHAFDPASGVLLLEDLGDTHLYNLVLAEREARSDLAGQGTPAVRDAYEEALQILLRLQAPPAEPFDPTRTPNPPYDRAFILRYEAGYFLREMVRNHCGLELPDLGTVDADCVRVAVQALSGTPSVLMHRDFQSRNLMRTPRGLVVIDFQGARPGPPEYDLAALVLDPYVDLPESLRDDLVESYIERAACTPAERTAARLRFRACGINRMMQVLGAFGYLGGRLGKPGFLEHAPVALAQLRELSRDEFPHLYYLAGRVAEKLPRRS